MSSSSSSETSHSASVDTKVASSSGAPVEDRSKSFTADPMKSLAESVATPLQPFDHKGLIAEPFLQESIRDQAYEQEVATMLLDIIIEVQAWASARPKHESDVALQKLEKTISELTEIEIEQGMSSPPDQTILDRIRERLKNFVKQITEAVKALI